MLKITGEGSDPTFAAKEKMSPGFTVADLEQKLATEKNHFQQCLAAMALSWRRRADGAVFPRDKACGDGLTPRAVAELQNLKLDHVLQGGPVNNGLRERRAR